MSAELVAFSIWTLFVAWIVVFGGAERLEDTFLGALLLGWGMENLPPGGIKAAMLVIWVFSVLGLILLR